MRMDYEVFRVNADIGQECLVAPCVFNLCMDGVMNEVTERVMGKEGGLSTRVMNGR